MKKLALFVCLMVLAALALSSQQVVEKSMCEKKAQLLLDKVLEMWNKPDLALIPELYAADCVALTSSMPVPYVGHEGIRKWIEVTRAELPDLVMTFPEVMAQGDRIFTIWTMAGTQTGPFVMPGGTLPPTGKKISITGMSIDYLKEGKIVKEVIVFNALDMLMPLGFQLMPPQPPPPPRRQ